MSNSPDLTPFEPPPHRSALLLKVVAGCGAVVGLGILAGVIWGKRLINGRLLPLVETRVADIIDRPIELGDVEQLWFNGVQLGKTTLPPTETDGSSATVDMVSLRFDLRSLLFEQTLEPHIVLTRPNLNLVQGTDKEWVELSLPEPVEEEPLVTTNIQSIEVQDATITARTLVQDPDAAVPREAVEIDGADVTAEFYGENSQNVYFDVTGEVEAGRFDIKGEADLDSQALKTTLRLQDLPPTGVNIFLPSLMGLESGTLNSNLTLAAALTDGELDPSSVDVQGTAQFRDVQVRFNDVAEPVRDIRSQLRFSGQQVVLDNTQLSLGDVDLAIAGLVDWQDGYDLTAQIPEVSLADVQTLAALDLPDNLPIDIATAFELNTQVTGQLDDPTIKGRLTNLEPLQVDRLNLATVSAEFDLPLSDYELSEFELTELRVIPEAGGEIVAQGQADFTNLDNPSFRLTGQTALPVDAFTQIYGVALPPDTVIGVLTATLDAEGTLKSQTASAQWQLSESTFPGRGELTLADNRLVANNTRLQVADGVVTADATAQLEGGDWQATIVSSEIPVEKFTNQAQGLLSARIDANGNLFELAPANIRAVGDAAIANAKINLPNNLVNNVSDIPLLTPGDWATQFAWQGDRIAIASFSAPSIRADGVIDVELDQPNPIENLDLNVALDNFNLAALNQLAPANVRTYGQLAGVTSFDGQITGPLNNLQLLGDAKLNNLALNKIQFEPLSGPVVFSLQEGGRVNLQGQQDRLQVAIDQQFLPIAFDIRNQYQITTQTDTRQDNPVQQEFTLIGRREENQLNVNITQFPLGKLDIRPADAYGFGRLTGQVNGQATVNIADLTNPSASGIFTIDQPSLNPIDAEQIVADFSYEDGVANLARGELTIKNSRYTLSGRALVSPELAYDGTLTIEQGRIEDIIALAQEIDPSVFSAQPFLSPDGSAADLVVTPAALPPGSLLEKLKAFATFRNSHSPSQTTATLIPASLNPSNLSGSFTGTIAVAGSAPNNLNADIDISGNSWQWGDNTPANNFVIDGSFTTGLNSSNQPATDITIGQIEINAGETQIALSGNGTSETIAGALTINSLPVELISWIYPSLPVTPDGDLNLETQISGRLDNPKITGNARVNNPQINSYPLALVDTSFEYRNASLAVDSTVAVDAADAPITLKGTIPYALPFVTVSPRTDNLSLKAVVPDDNFDIVNTLTQETIRWEDGSGEIVVEANGTLTQPIVVGNARFRQGVVSSKFLADPVTDLTGDIQFDLALLEDQISIGERSIPLALGKLTVSQLQASLQDGQLQIDGQLPLSPFDQPADGMTIALNALPVDYSDAVKSVFDGRIAVDGSILSPILGGNLAVGAGKISTLNLINQFRGGDDAIAAETDTEEQPTEPNSPIRNQIMEAVALYRDDVFGEESTAIESEDLPLGIVGQLVSFDNFEIQLSEQLLIEGQPFFNLRASGDIIVDGSLANPRPDGEIALEAGWINLFSTQFRLDTSEDNQATFTPDNGIYPILDVTMRTRVQEKDIARVPAVSETTGIVSSEIADNQNADALGDVEYINIRASVTDLDVREVVQGTTEQNQDQLSQFVVLESDPSRNQRTLIALLGNNVISGITNAGLTQVAGFVGAGNVVSFINNVADTLGFQSFSVFPTTDTATDSTAGIGIGVEAIFEVTDDINVSILEILNNGNAPQFGLQYELTEELRLRGSSNLDDTEFRIEYRLDF